MTVPKDVNDAACDAAKGFGVRLVGAGGSGEQLAYVAIDIATKAILAERKRCADVARSWVSVANSVLNSGDGFSEAHWNGRLFAAEYIAKEIESGA